MQACGNTASEKHPSSIPTKNNLTVRSELFNAVLSHTIPDDVSIDEKMTAWPNR
jgi:hypothetical protein